MYFEARSPDDATHPPVSTSTARGVGSSARSMVIRIGQVLATVPASSVVEALRPLPIERLPDMSACVTGVALIRGVATPVIDARILFAIVDPAPPARWLVLRVGERKVALAVDEVLGLQSIEHADLETLPRLLGSASSGLVEQIGELDARLLVVLDRGRLVPEAVWSALAARRGE